MNIKQEQMEVDVEENLRNSQQAFISKIISHTTHDFKNQLAIINESAGLMGDLLGMQKEGDLTNKERYQKIINSIQDRVITAAELALKLNFFGHRMDHPAGSFNINDLLQEELHLLGRYASQKQVELITDLSIEVPAINNHPAICQYIFFICFEYLVNRFEGPKKIQVATRSAEEIVQVEISAAGTIKDGTANLLNGLIESSCYGLSKMDAELANAKVGDNQQKLTISLKSLPSG
jgi:signal transduction histidine kinase